MMSFLKLECAICFNEVNSFKILDCGHHFCVNCVDQLRSASAVPSAPMVSLCSTTISEPDQSTTLKTKDMECPQCRQVTPALSVLKMKFVTRLLCRQCDEEKFVEEFRWCFQCAVSICSKCFVDKHMSVESDGMIRLHPAAKWDNEYPAVKYCIEQLKRESGAIDENVKKAQDYTKSYLEGLQEYLFREIEQKIRASSQYNAKIAAIAHAYGIDAQALHAAEVPAKNYETLVGDLIKIANIQMPPDVANEQQLKLKSLPYKNIADLLFGACPTTNNAAFPDSTGSDTVSKNSSSTEENMEIVETVSNTNEPRTIVYNDALTFPIYPVINNEADNSDVATKEVATTNKSKGACAFEEDMKSIDTANVFFDTEYLNRKFGHSLIIGADSVKQPADVCYVPSLNVLLISDFVGGLFTYQNGTVRGPMINKHPMHHFSRLTLLPLGPVGPAVLVNVQVGPAWHYTIVGISPNGVVEQLRIRNKDSAHWSFPTPKNPTVASSNRSTFCLTHKSLHRFLWPEEAEWVEVYTMSAKDRPRGQARLGPVLDLLSTTQVFICNATMQAVDMVTFAYPTYKLLSVRRFEWANYFPMIGTGAVSMLEPFLAKLDENGECLLLADKKGTKVFAWNRAEEKCTTFHDFSTKIPQKIVHCGGVFWLITQQKDYPNVRAVEMVEL